MGFNSKEQAWSDVRIAIAGKPVVGIRGFKYKVAQEKEHLYGAGDEPIGIQRGNRQYEGEIKLLKFEYDLLDDAAKLAGARDILDIRFDIIIKYSKNIGGLIRMDSVRGAEFKDYELGMEQGAKMMEITLPVIFSQLDLDTSH